MVRVTAIVTIIALSASGCGYAGVRLWPRQTIVETVAQRGVLEVRSSPRGATVDGHPTPYRQEVPYTVATSYRHYSRWGFVIGAALSVAVGAALTVWSMDQDQLLGIVAGSLLFSSGGIDLGFSAYIVDSLNRRARHARVETVVPSPFEADVAWEDFAPVHVTAMIPADHVVVRRPATIEFEQGLIHWARTSGRTLAGAELFAVGRAYAHRAQRDGADADRAAAIDYLTRYLADPAATSAAEASALIEALGR